MCTHLNPMFTHRVPRRATSSARRRPPRWCAERSRNGALSTRRPPVGINRETLRPWRSLRCSASESRISCDGSCPGAPSRALRGVAAEPISPKTGARACLLSSASPPMRPACMRSVSAPRTAPGAFTSAHTCAPLCVGHTEGTSIENTARDDRGRDFTSTSRTWDVSGAARCQRQHVPSHFSA